jgi:regulator of RNase E activity RraA
MNELSAATRDALSRVGTSTLTGILSRRGLRNIFLREVWPIRPDMPRMVGPAFTMRFIPAREDKTATGSGPVQQRAMEECPPGHVLVVDGGWSDFARNHLRSHARPTPALFRPSR